MAKRRPGHLLRLDSRVLDVAELLAEHFDGADRAATGAVYKSLARLVALDLLDERWAGRCHVYALNECGRDAIVPARMGGRVFGRSSRTLRRRASPRS